MSELYKPLYMEIYENILKELESGKYSKDSRLPTEKELAERFNVSRITSKKAMDMLAENGIIKRIPGKGSYISDNSVFGTGENEEKSNTVQEINKKIIGYVLSDFSESYGTGLLSGIEKEAEKNGLFVCFRRSHGSQKAEEDAIKELIDLGVSGIIVMPVHGKHYNPIILRLVLDGFPVVMVDRYMKGINGSFVVTDNVKASKNATDYLFGLGHKNISFLSPPSNDTSTLEERIEGFVTSHLEHGVTVDRSIWLTDLITTVPGNFSEENYLSDIEKIKALVVNNPQITCLYASEYNIGLMALKAVRSLGKNVPGDISILCFDEAGNFTNEYLFTHVRQNEYEMGTTAVRLLKEQIEHNMDKKCIYFDSELVLGSSTKSLIK